MADKKQAITARRGEKGTPDFQEASGFCNVYSDAELGRLVSAGLAAEHAPMLNEIIVIRAQDGLRRTLADVSVEGQLRKASPEVKARVKALIAEAMRAAK